MPSKLLNSFVFISHIVYIYITAFMQVVVGKQSYPVTTVTAPFQLIFCAACFVTFAICAPCKRCLTREIYFRFKPKRTLSI